MHRVTDDSLDRMAAAVDAGRHSLDNDTRPRHGAVWRHVNFARADDRSVATFENADLAGPQRQRLVWRQIGPGSHHVLERQEFAHLARNGRSRKGNVAIHRRIGEDDPYPGLVLRTPNRCQNFVRAERPERGRRVELPALTREERVRGGYVLAEVERTLGRELGPAFCGAHRMGDAFFETVFEAHRDENSVTQGGGRPHQKLRSLLERRLVIALNCQPLERGRKNDLPEDAGGSGDSGGPPRLEKIGRRQENSRKPLKLGKSIKSSYACPERNFRIASFVLGALGEERKNPIRRVRRRATAKAGDAELLEFKEPSSERVDPGSSLRFIGERDREILPFGRRDPRVAGSHVAPGKPQLLRHRTAREHGGDAKIEDDLQRPFARQPNELGEVEIRGNRGCENVSARERKAQSIEPQPRGGRKGGFPIARAFER